MDTELEQAPETVMENTNQEFEDMASELNEESANDDGTDSQETAAAETSTTPEDEVGVETETPDTEEETANNAGNPADKDANAFAQMRIQNKQLADTLALGAKAAGMEVEDFVKKLENDALQADAKAQQIPVEVLSRIRELEARDEAREQEHQNMVFRNHIEGFQSKMNLSQTDLRDFIGACVGKGIDVAAQSTDLEVLYRGMYFDKLVESQKQDWIKRDSKIQGQVSLPSSGKGKANTPEGGVIDTLEELDAIFDQM